MIIFDKLILSGVRFVLDKVGRTVNEELNDPSRLRDELLRAELALEAGEIDEAEFTRIEADVLARLRNLRESGDAELSFSDSTVSSVEVDCDADLPEPPAATSPPKARPKRARRSAGKRKRSRRS